MGRVEPGDEEDQTLATLGYAEALTELDAILRDLDSSDVDVDQLADKVARAHLLIRVCRQRISAAALQIKDLTDQESES
jgi:exodeoxyribonuclease VII small subunit